MQPDYEQVIRDRTGPDSTDALRREVERLQRELTASRLAHDNLMAQHTQTIERASIRGAQASVEEIELRALAARLTAALKRSRAERETIEAALRILLSLFELEPNQPKMIVDADLLMCTVRQCLEVLRVIDEQKKK